MAMKNKNTKKRQRRFDRPWKRLRGKRDDPDTTKQYTPQDVHALLSKPENGSGIIRPNTDNLHITSDLESIGEGEQTDTPRHILLVIVTLALIFISIITFFVSRMPIKD
jgi:hypothetical protein